MWPAYAEVWEVLGSLESALTSVLRNPPAGDILVTESTVLWALLIVFQELIWLYQQKKLGCLCCVDYIPFRRGMSIWPHWSCCPAGACCCRQTSGQHETAENWTSVDVCNAIICGMNHLLKILPQKMFKRSDCKNDLFVGFGIAQLFTYESRYWALLWRLKSFPKHAVWSTCCIWKSITREK